MGASWFVLFTKFIPGYQIRKNEMSGAWDTCGKRRGTCRVLLGQTYGKRPLGSPGCGWVDDIKIDFKSVAGARTRFI
jgi:hypothetical protein